VPFQLAFRACNFRRMPWGCDKRASRWRKDNSMLLERRDPTTAVQSCNMIRDGGVGTRAKTFSMSLPPRRESTSTLDAEVTSKHQYANVTFPLEIISSS